MAKRNYAHADGQGQQYAQGWDGGYQYPVMYDTAPVTDADVQLMTASQSTGMPGYSPAYSAYPHHKKKSCPCGCGGKCGCKKGKPHHVVLGIAIAFLVGVVVTRIVHK